MISRKVVFLSSILLILLLPLTLSYIPQRSIAQSSSTTSTTGDLLTYTNTDYGFTIKYPSDWIVYNMNSTRYGVEPFSKAGYNATKFSSPDGSGAVIIQIENAKSVSLGNMSMYYLHHPIGGGRLLEFNNNYFLSGHPAIRTIEIKSYPSHDVKTMAFSTILGGKIYTIGYVVVAERFPDYLQIAQTMIDSFQIINKQ